MGRSPNKFKRTKKLSAPANEQELSAYSAACQKVKMEPADTLRKLAEAFVEHVNEHGHVTQPIKLAKA